MKVVDLQASQSNSATSAADFDENLFLLLSRRSNYIHMGLNIPLYSIKNYPDFIEEINKFLAKDLESRFELIYPLLVLTVKWKFDCITLSKLKKHKNNGK